MKTIIIQCQNCSKSFEKPLNEYTRRIKNNSPMYCSRRCSGQKNISNFGEKRNTLPPVGKYKANPFKYYLRNCKRRNRQEFDLSLDYLEEVWNNQEGICPYTKINLLLNTHSYRNPDIRYVASLDRIDNSKGYIKGNVQFVSLAINYMKSNLTHDETMEFLKHISSNFLEDRTISS